MVQRLEIICRHVAASGSTQCVVPLATRSAVLQRGCRDTSTAGLDISINDDGVAILRLSNDRARNPLSKDILLRLREVLQECAAMDVSTFKSAKAAPIQCVVIASTGPVFSSGHDMRDFTVDVSDEDQVATLELCAEVNMLLSSVPQPSVALVDGHAMAGGCQLVASCDLLLCTENSKFTLPGVRSKEGFCHTPSVAVAAKIGRKALRFNLLGDDVTARDAKEVGLVDIISDLDNLNETITTLAKRFDNQMAIGKQTFYTYTRGPALERMYGVATPVMVKLMKNANEGFTKFLAGKRRSGVVRKNQS